MFIFRKKIQTDDSDYFFNNIHNMTELYNSLSSYKREFSKALKNIDNNDPIYYMLKTEVSCLSSYFDYEFKKDKHIVKKFLKNIQTDIEIDKIFPRDSKSLFNFNNRDDIESGLFQYYFFILEEVRNKKSPFLNYKNKQANLHKVFEDFHPPYVNEKIEILLSYLIERKRDNGSEIKDLLDDNFKKTKDFLYAQRKFLEIHSSDAVQNIVTKLDVGIHSKNYKLILNNLS